MAASLDHYFLAGRTMPWYLLGIAGMSNWFDMTGTMIITSFLYMLGPRGLFIEFRGGAVLVLAFMLCYTGKWHRRSGCMTGAEWMTYRFGQGKDAELVRVITAFMSIVLTIGMSAYFVRGTSLFVGMMFPYPPVETTAVLVGITALYTMCGGFYAVVFTDLVQGVIIMSSCLIVGFMAWHMIPNSAHLALVAKEMTGSAQWITSMPAWHTSMPKGYEVYETLIVFSFFYLLRNILSGMGTGGEARYFGAKSDRDCGLQSLLQGVTVMLRWPLMMGFAVMGIYLVHNMFPDTSAIARAHDLISSYYPHVSASAWHDLTNRIANTPSHYPAALIDGLKSTLGSAWSLKLPMVGCEGTVNPERILPAVIMYSMPVGLKGLLIVAMIAAMKSAFGGMLNAGSAYFVKDIYQILIRPKASNRELIAASYLSTLAMVVIGFHMGVRASNINDLWGWLMMSLLSGTAAPGLLRLYWWRCNAWGMFGGMFLGGVGSIVQRALLPGLLEWQQFILMTTLSFAGTIVVSLVTQPTSMDTLTHFYRTTRPFGAWGPVRAAFNSDEVREMTKEHRNDIISVPFALLSQITIFLLPMQLVIKVYDSFWKTLPIFIVGAIGMYFFWWRNLPLAVEEVKEVVISEKVEVGVRH
ncbi:MAG: sodium:solute symporter family transporter [Armatimonadota bacterium]